MLTARTSSDDKVEESRLSDGFDLTCRAWEVRSSTLQNECVSLTEPPQTRFGIPYMHCGCPLPVRPPSEDRFNPIT